MILLICNAGSTSLKLKVYDMPSEVILASGGVERVGSLDDAVFRYANEARGVKECSEKQCVPDYRTGIARFLDCLTDPEKGALSDLSQIDRVGFKTVLSRGYYSVHKLTEPVIEGMRVMLSAAPTHNRCYLEAIAAVREVLPDAMFVGVFETFFHQNLPLERRIFGVPWEWYEKYGVKRMGYHSCSHSHAAERLAELEGTEYRAVSCHLGGSGSVCAIRNGESQDSSFGLTLETGLIHNNRTGEVDGDLFAYLRAQGLSEEEIFRGMAEEGGLLGISGVSKDLRYVLAAAEQGNERARLAVDVYVTGIVRYIGAFSAELGGLDCLVFTGGIGENSAVIRAEVCRRVAHMGVRLSAERNGNGTGDRCISEDGSPVRVYVIASDEEQVVARKTYACPEE